MGSGSLIKLSLVARETVEPAMEKSWPKHTDSAEVAGHPSRWCFFSKAESGRECS